MSTFGGLRVSCLAKGGSGELGNLENWHVMVAYDSLSPSFPEIILGHLTG